jgi:hypothetical protein
METAGRRIQDWTNKNVFVSSFESNELPLPSYQNENGAQPAGDLHGEADVGVAPPSDPHAPGGKLITALQAAWNVTNAIQGMFIVGLPFAVKVSVLDCID